MALGDRKVVLLQDWPHHLVLEPNELYKQLGVLNVVVLAILVAAASDAPLQSSVLKHQKFW